MGWSGTTHFTDRKTECRREFGDNYKILADTMVGNTYYAAVKHLRPEWKGHVFVAVTLTKIGKHGGQRELLTKGMDEGCGPCEIDCPASILDLASPLDDENDRNGYARAWRQRCRDRLASKKKALKLVEGLRVSLPEPVSFGGGVSSHQHFTVRKVQSWRKMRTVFVPDGCSWLASLRPHNKALLMTRETWEAQQAAAIKEANETAGTAAIEDYLDIAA